MADSKISALGAVTDLLDADEYVLARSGASNKITGANLKLGAKGLVAVSRASNTILAAADKGKVFNCTATFTQTLTAAATLGAGWYCMIRNNTTDGGTILTVDPNGSETIDGRTTIPMYSGDTRWLLCDGSGFTTILLRGGVYYREGGGTVTLDLPTGAVSGRIAPHGSGGSGGGGVNANGSSASGGAAGGGGCYTEVGFSFAQLGNGTKLFLTIPNASTGGAAGSAGADGAICSGLVYNSDTPGNTILLDVEGGGGGKGAVGAVAAASRGGGGGSQFGGASGGISASPSATGTNPAVGVMAAKSTTAGNNGDPSERGGATGGGGVSGAAGQAGGDSLLGGPGGGAGGGVSAVAGFNGGAGGYSGEWGVGDSGGIGAGNSSGVGSAGSCLNETATTGGDAAGGGGGGTTGGGVGGNAKRGAGGGGGGSSAAATGAAAGGNGGPAYLRFEYW